MLEFLGNSTHPRNLNCEIFRLLSFVNIIDFTLQCSLAKYGFYSTSNNAKCYFCNLTLDPMIPDLVIEPHFCDKTRNVELPIKLTDFRYEANRIISFLSSNDWQQQQVNVSALDLARSGFYFMEESHAAKCYFCNLTIRGWQSGDTAELEHVRLSPGCPLLTFPDANSLKLGAERDDIHDLNLALPEYADYQQRLSTFDAWPGKLMNSPISAFVDFGLTYSRMGDRVLCYQCGGGLCNWDPDEVPYLAHDTFFPACPGISARTMAPQQEELLQTYRVKNTRLEENGKVVETYGSLQSYKSRPLTFEEVEKCALELYRTPNTEFDMIDYKPSTETRLIL